MGSTGMLINKKYIKDNVDSWQVLWDARYADKIAMLDDPFDVIAVACKLLGHSINTEKPDELLQARQLLLRQKPLLRGYLDVTTIQTLMLKEELWAAHIYSGEGLAAAAGNKQLAYITPREGASIWTDYFIIPRDARHKQEALPVSGLHIAARSDGRNSLRTVVCHTQYRGKKPDQPRGTRVTLRVPSRRSNGTL